MRRFARTWAILMGAAFLWLLSACDTTSSENVKTSGIWAKYQVDDNGDGTVTAWALLRVGGPNGTIVDLTGGEHVECNGAALTEYLDPITNLHWSRGIIPAATDGQYTFEFVRTDETVSTEISAADPPIIDQVADGSTWYMGQDGTITWDSTMPGDKVDIDIHGDCIDDVSYLDVTDNGSFTVPAADVVLSGTDDICDLTVQVTRYVGYDVNPTFQGGEAWATAFDAVTVTYTPMTPGN